MRPSPQPRTQPQPQPRPAPAPPPPLQVPVTEASRAAAAAAEADRKEAEQGAAAALRRALLLGEDDADGFSMASSRPGDRPDALVSAEAAAAAQLSRRALPSKRRAKRGIYGLFQVPQPLLLFRNPDCSRCRNPNPTGH